MSDKIINIDEQIVSYSFTDKEHKLTINNKEEKLKRPDTLEGRTTALRSKLLKSTLYITLNYIENNGRFYPFEIFFNTKDTSKFVELTLITRLVSAVFRRTDNTEFIIKEFMAIANPEGNGYFRPPRFDGDKGKYIPSIYYEIGEVLIDFFNFLAKKNGVKPSPDLSEFLDEEESIADKIDALEKPEPGIILYECPECHKRKLKKEGGCSQCLDCGYSKCE